MLVLSRNPGEEIVIDGPCTITVLEVRKGRRSARVRLGIEAKPDVRVLRRELIERGMRPAEAKK